MKYTKFIENIKKGEIASAYLFEGEEVYLKNKALKEIKEKFMHPKYEDFNYEIISGKDASTAQIGDSLATLPFKGTKRVVVIEEAEKLSSANQKFLLEFLVRITNSTCLICSGKFDKKTEFYRAFKKKKRVVSFYRLWDNEAVDWIRKETQKKGGKITSEAAVHLEEKIGNDLTSLIKEIEKLFLFIYPRRLIEKKDVKEAVGEGKRAGIFDLTKTVRERELSRALLILSELLDKENPMKIHSLMAREIRLLLRVKGKKESLFPRKICPLIFPSVKYYSSFHINIAKEYIQASKKFTLSQLIKGYQQLVEAEASIKRGKEEPYIALQRVFLNLLKK
ncbi:MAG: DNA polymerase III subunit delta [Candidatus Aerophobetes bacterium]|nr:DNA polymerase III subunit delta [Candidatus Aerophobetes bacterium]